MFAMALSVDSDALERTHSENPKRQFKSTSLLCMAKYDPKGVYDSIRQFISA